LTIPIHAGSAHGTGPASPWLERWAELLQPGMRALDLACGAGRHVRWLSERGLHVTAVDRDTAALAELHGVAAEVLAADLEAAPWPLPGRQFDLVLVTNYLWRPLLPQIVASVAPGGVLLYETFALGQETVGRPRNPEFLLHPGELLDLVRGRLRVIAYEDRRLDAPPRFVQRIAAMREA
jgi:SAM-dependent methyltransferase